MVDLSIPGRERLEGANDYDLGDLPRFARARRHRDPPAVDDVRAATQDAVEALDFSDVPAGGEVAITAGSRGIADAPELLAAVVDEVELRGYEPFVFPSMGSHGGATAEGQVETLRSVGVTEERVGCPIRSSMAVEEVGTDVEGRPVFVAEDALAADGVVLANRVKAHTDYSGGLESGLAKMAVVGMGKHRGAEVTHNAALARGFDAVIGERAEIVLDAAPVVGGLALLENAHEHAAEIVGLPADRILDEEPDLLDRSKELLATLPVDDLDLLVVDEMGKEISGTGMDTNVLGRVDFHGQAEPDEPDITRVYVRSLTEASHGNAVGVGLADFAHVDVLEAIDLGDTYVNIATSGEPSRARLPYTVPADATALLVACSMTGVRDPADLRVARIENTLEPDDLLVSEPVADELADHSEVAVSDLEPLAFDADGELETPL
ncbi:hypothetical protein SAMN05216559_0681 [Halomicrobium zhouii]|uniref:Uncharacterized protein n=1 Tax=Halomicrobium zhouii TaxID=767519 RepID=A0A1I6KEV5_9EURY|nr:DUF362 domain-containing protein [Halomicrobium zhouii]SFR89743.1 hypothetical protein SAMN05216559_0681 [Halomicrobium zhouii]